MRLAVVTKLCHLRHSNRFLIMFLHVTDYKFELFQGFFLGAAHSHGLKMRRQKKHQLKKPALDRQLIPLRSFVTQSVHLFYGNRKLVII